MTRRDRFTIALLAAVSAAACTGSIADEGAAPAGGGAGPVAPRAPGQTGSPGSPGSPASPTPAGPGAPPPTTPPSTTPGATPAAPAGPLDRTLPMPLRRLTSVEYRNTIRDLLGEANPPVSDYPQDSQGASGFIVGDTGITLPDAQNIATAAEKVAAAAVAKLDKLLPCAPAGDGSACARQLITTFGRRVYRRPLLPAEIDELVALYGAGRTQHAQDFAGAVSLVLQAMFASPSFLYHWQRGPVPASRTGDVVRLAPHEVASRLSYFLWASTPDADLSTAADKAALETPEQLEAHARRLLRDPRARETLVSFFSQWLQLSALGEVPKDQKLPNYRPTLLGSMMRETQTFVANVVVDGDGSLRTLLTAPYSFVDADLARVYGVAPPATPFAKTALDPTRRAGILTHPSQMAIGSGALETSPVVRGKEIRLNFLCDAVAAPPDDIPPLPDANKSVRARFEAHTASPQCAGCHRVMDPIGWGFEHYDPVGNYRTTDRGEPVNARGVLESLKDGSKRDFDGAVELAKLLADSPEVHRCFAQKWLRFALGRPDVPGDGPSLMQAGRAFADRGLDVRELLVALVRTDSFTTRSPAAGEVLR